MKITLTVEIDTNESLEDVKDAIKMVICKHLPSEIWGSISFSPEPTVPDTILPIPIKGEDYKEYSTVWYYSIQYDTIGTACNPEYFCELDTESGVFLTEDEAIQFKDLYQSNMIKFNEAKQTWELI